MKEDVNLNLRVSLFSESIKKSEAHLHKFVVFVELDAHILLFVN